MSFIVTNVEKIVSGFFEPSSERYLKDRYLILALRISKRAWVQDRLEYMNGAALLRWQDFESVDNGLK